MVKVRLKFFYNLTKGQNSTKSFHSNINLSPSFEPDAGPGEQHGEHGHQHGEPGGGGGGRVCHGPRQAARHPVPPQPEAQAEGPLHTGTGRTQVLLPVNTVFYVEINFLETLSKIQHIPIFSCPP